jgi:hypothetical protein
VFPKYSSFKKPKFTDSPSGKPDFPEQITSYLIKEASYQAIVGPSKGNPFNDQIALSPLNSVPRKDSSERRVIVD